MSRHVEVLAAAARKKSNAELLDLHKQGVAYLADGHLPALFDDLMDATELVLTERSVDVPSRYARPSEAVAL